MDNSELTITAYNHIANNEFSKAKPIIKNLIGNGINDELNTQGLKKIKINLPDISGEKDND